MNRHRAAADSTENGSHQKGLLSAFSLILRPTAVLRPHLSRTVGLAALSIADLFSKLGLVPLIKWPNDILLSGKKTAGIFLIETVWSGEDIDLLVIGMGINIYKSSVPPAELLQFPATSLEDELGKEPPAREEILFSILGALIHWREHMGTNEFINVWEGLWPFAGSRFKSKQEAKLRSQENCSVSNLMAACACATSITNP